MGSSYDKVISLPTFYLETILISRFCVSGKPGSKQVIILITTFCLPPPNQLVNYF